MLKKLWHPDMVVNHILPQRQRSVEFSIHRANEKLFGVVNHLT